MKCKHCDATIEHGADRCYRCGTPCQVIPSPPPPPIQKPPFHHRHAFLCSAVFIIGVIALIVTGMIMMNTNYNLLYAGGAVAIVGAVLLPFALWFASEHLKYWGE